MDCYFFAWYCTSPFRRFWYWYCDARMKGERGFGVGATFAGVYFILFFFFFFFFAFYVLALRARRVCVHGSILLFLSFHRSRRGRLTRGSAFSYGFSLFLYLLFYSVVEYVDIDALTYFKAPGPYCGAEERWRARPLSEDSFVVSQFPLSIYVFFFPSVSFNN